MNQQRDDEREGTGGGGQSQPSSEGAQRTTDSGGGADGARHAILARRAKFVTMALASAGIAVASQGCKDPEPTVCLSQEQVPTSSAGAVPEPCLTAEVCLEAPMIKDAGTMPTGSAPGTPPSGSAAADSPAKADGGPTEPQVCLKIRPDPPQPCLSKPLPPQPCLSKPPPPRPCLTKPHPPTSTS
ncbi:MAG: hypothetical protein JRI68_20765 [Deltaproteobacteria bacterium]|nr:hypothetical protein [Deltaproteobacteria bacterium]